ncbi:MAG TPA: hypothetical protein PK573_01685 [Spirochaetota bacterium]|nr:hypothetical protein [Spirochaetota bacterium]HRZ27993.1 hypothetical protein [Spirochaetota bacterium]HSA14124.1 hypothetical protein [Spirochaetota bacterium]
MYIHIGDREVISDKKCLGIFNASSLKMSPENSWITGSLGPLVKTVALLEDNTVLGSRVSPFTVIKRTSLDNEKDLVWRRK